MSEETTKRICAHCMDDVHGNCIMIGDACPDCYRAGHKSLWEDGKCKQCNVDHDVAMLNLKTQLQRK